MDTEFSAVEGKNAKEPTNFSFKGKFACSVKKYTVKLVWKHDYSLD